MKPSHRLVAGEVVEGEVSVPEQTPPEPEDIPLDIRYEDDHVLVVSKPAGLVSHPAGGHRSGTLVNALLGTGKPLGMLDPSRPGLVHRLDRDTSGLLLVAKDDETQARLRAAMKAREIGRSYYALGSRSSAGLRNDRGSDRPPPGPALVNGRRLWGPPGGHSLQGDGVERIASRCSTSSSRPAARTRSACT